MDAHPPTEGNRIRVPKSPPFRWLIGLLFALPLLLPLGYFLAPHLVVQGLQSLTPQVLYRVDTREPLVALTFDDGPDSLWTPRILDLLHQHGAKATFFLITDRVPGQEALLQRMVEEGHEIGNHLTQDRISALLSPPRFEAALLQAHRTLQPFAAPLWLRPGAGWFTPEMLVTAEEHGYRIALGSLYPFDAKIPSSRFATGYLVAHLQPGDIIILHDNGQRGRRALETASALLSELDRRGIRSVTLGELIASGSRGP